jgi:hypothetical protein
VSSFRPELLADIGIVPIQLNLTQFNLAPKSNGANLVSIYYPLCKKILACNKFSSAKARQG